MDSDRINELLNRYWNCETSLEEEQALRDFFKKNDVPEPFKETAALFQYFENQKTQSLKDHAFDSQVMSNVNQSKTRSLIYNAMRMAAGITVLIMAIWFIRGEVQTSQPFEDTYDDPKMAFEETKKALLMISKSFQSAEKQTQKINLFNEAQQEISKKDKEVQL